MARMLSPDGEIAEVPDELVPHYRDLGAEIIGPEEESLEADPLLDPTDLLFGGLGAGALMRAVPGAARAVGRSLGRAGGFMLGRRAPAPAARPLADLPRLPSPLDVPPRAFTKFLKRMMKRRIPGMQQAEEVGELLSEVKAEQATRRAQPAIEEALERIKRGAGMPQLETRPQGRVVGEIKPHRPFRPKAAKSRTMTAEEQAAAREKGRKTAEPSRHEVQYYSESQGKFIPIETMHIAQLRNAMNKLGRRLAESKRPSPVVRKQFEALTDEVTHRLRQAGELTVPGPVARSARGSQAMRGASKPALERRAAARVKAQSRPPEPEMGAPDDLEALLGQSLELEQKLAREGLTPIERAAKRAAILRGEL